MRKDWCGELETLVGKVLRREQEIIDELAPALPSMPSIQALLTAFTALDQRIERLGAKITEKADKLTDAAVEADGDGSVRDALDARRDGALLTLEHTWQRFRAKACADAARALWPAAQQEMLAGRHCKGCGAELRVARPYEPETVRCSYCGGVTTVLVSDGVSAYYNYAPAFLAGETCLPLRHEIEVALARYQANVPDTSTARVTALVAIEALESRHWKLFCETRAGVLGVPPDYGLHDARVEAFRREYLEREPAWQATR